MWPDRVSNPGPLTYESGALPTALRGPACGSVAQMWFGSSVEFSHAKPEAWVSSPCRTMIFPSPMTVGGSVWVRG